MDILKFSAFSDGNKGGNPAGVVILEEFPDDSVMQAAAARVGFSETVFAKALNKESIREGLRVRYFSPESEVPFCGHATIALGAALAQKYGDGVFDLSLNQTKISVEGKVDEGLFKAALQSPATRSKPLSVDLLDQALALFGYSFQDLEQSIPPALIHAGANHLLIALNSRSALADMKYDLDAGRAFMNKEGLVTVMFVFPESKQSFYVRNPFASGGVYEDPATGAAAAAFSGYLRDIDWPHAGYITIIQGEDMLLRSIINAQISEEKGASIRVSGTARLMKD